MKRRLAVGAAAVCAAALLVSACVTEETYTGAVEAAGPRVAIMGDQITYQARNKLHADLDADFQVRLSGWAGLTFDEFDTQKASAFDGDNPAVALIQLGSDDIVTGEKDHATEEVTMAAIDRMYDRFPGSCTVGVTVDEHMAGPDRDTALAARINEKIRSRATMVVEWSDALVGHPEYLNAGSVSNPSSAGQDVYVSMVHDAVVGCISIPSG